MVAVKYVNIIPPARAQGPVAAVYKQARRELGILPEVVTMFSPAPEVCVAAWALFREVMTATGQVPRSAKEAVAAVVSRQNECPYCLDAHASMLYAADSGGFATQLLRGIPVGQLEHSMRPLAEWAERATRQATASGQVPFQAAQLPELIGTIAEFHFVNRVTNVLVPRTFLPGPRGAHRVMRSAAGVALRGKIRKTRPSGRAAGFDFSAAIRLPDDLSWARPSPSVAAALAGLSAATDAMIAQTVSAPATAAVRYAIARWTGEAPPLGRAWLEEALVAVPAQDRPAARLALLAAFAPYRVTDEDVRACRAHHPADSDLIGLLAWSAFTAARRVAAWTAAAAGVVAKPEPAP